VARSGVRRQVLFAACVAGKAKGVAEPEPRTEPWQNELEEEKPYAQARLRAQRYARSSVCRRAQRSATRREAMSARKGDPVSPEKAEKRQF